MAISFPSNPTLNQTYTYLSVTYVYDGKRWTSTTTLNSLSANTVTTTALADESVTSTKIATGTITASDIADGAITASKLAPGAGMNLAAVTGYNLVFGG